MRKIKLTLTNNQMRMMIDNIYWAFGVMTGIEGYSNWALSFPRELRMGLYSNASCLMPIYEKYSRQYAKYTRKPTFKVTLDPGQAGSIMRFCTLEHSDTQYSDTDVIEYNNFIAEIDKQIL